MLIYTVLNIEGGGELWNEFGSKERCCSHTHAVSVCFPDLLLLTSEMFGPFVQTLTVLLAHSGEVVGGRLSVGVLLCVCNGFAPTSFHAESFPTTRVVQAAGSDGQVRLQNLGCASCRGREFGGASASWVSFLSNLSGLHLWFVNQHTEAGAPPPPTQKSIRKKSYCKNRWICNLNCSWI